NAAAETVLLRYLDTHALIGLGEVLARYPFEAGWARRQLEQWAAGGRAVALTQSGPEPVQWSAPENLEQVQRSTLALLRREVLTCPPMQFADFQVRWQYLHPETNRTGPEGLAEVLERLAGLPIPGELWDTVVL